MENRILAPNPWLDAIANARTASGQREVADATHALFDECERLQSIAKGIGMELGLPWASHAISDILYAGGEALSADYLTCVTACRRLKEAQLEARKHALLHISEALVAQKSEVLRLRELVARVQQADLSADEDTMQQGGLIWGLGCFSLVVAYCVMGVQSPRLMLLGPTFATLFKVATITASVALVWWITRLVPRYGRAAELRSAKSEVQKAEERYVELRAAVDQVNRTPWMVSREAILKELG
jgi:hypothetical protein